MKMSSYVTKCMYITYIRMYVHNLQSFLVAPKFMSLEVSKAAKKFIFVNATSYCILS